MNVGFIYGLPLYPPGVGGSIHGYQLAKGLKERGHRLYSWYYGDDESPLVSHFRGRQALRFVRTIDVLYLRVSWSALMCRFARLRWLRLRRLPVVWELNGLPEELLYYGQGREQMNQATARLRRFARGVDAAIGVTPRIRDYLREELGIARSYCIPNGSDAELFAPRQGPPEPAAALKVAWIGKANCPWHDLDGLLEAARILARRGVNVELTLFGQRDKLPAELPPNVRCPGPVPYLKLGEELGRLDAGLVVFKPAPDGTPKDVLPLKLFDYMASGLAVLSQDAGETGRIVRQWQAGLITTGAPEDLAERIAALERDRSLCRRLGRNGRRAVEEYYNWTRVAEETERVLRAACCGDEPDPPVGSESRP